MKASFHKGGLIVEPETPEEISQFQAAFPKSYLKSSKVAKVKEFTNRFGEAEGSSTYLYVSGVKEAGDIDPSDEKEESFSQHFNDVVPAQINS